MAIGYRLALLKTRMFKLESGYCLMNFQIGSIR